MGARASVSFKNGAEKSVVLFSHWGGDSFQEEAKQYAATLQQKIKLDKALAIWPLGRLEPRTVMVDFVRHITKDETIVKSDFYLGKSESDGDNSDYGHKTIDLSQDITYGNDKSSEETDD